MAVGAEGVLELFASRTVVDLAAIQETLGGVSAMTAFRHLRGISYRRSYNHNGRFYALHDPARYDRIGLWSVGDIHFSRDCTLTNTVRRLVHEAAAGMTHRELLDRLRVRVQNTLLDLLRKREIERERLVQVYVYLHTDAAVREAQLCQRKEHIAAVAEASEAELSDTVVIAVLLTLIRHPGARPAAVTKHLRGHSPPITIAQVDAVLARYALGEKKGPSM